MDIRYHFVRDQVKDIIMELKYLTKKFEMLLNKAKLGDFKSRGSVGITEFCSIWQKRYNEIVIYDEHRLIVS